MDESDVSAKTIGLDIKSPQADTIFVKALLSTRHLFTGRNYTKGYVELVSILNTQDIYFDIAGATSGRKHFLDQFNEKKRKNNHTGFWLSLSVIFGKASADVLTGTRCGCQ